MANLKLGYNYGCNVFFASRFEYYDVNSSDWQYSQFHSAISRIIPQYTVWFLDTAV